MYISIPTSSASDIASGTTAIITSVKDPVIMVLGLLLAFFIAGAIIDLIRSKKEVAEINK